MLYFCRLMVMEFALNRIEKLMTPIVNTNSLK